MNIAIDARWIFEKISGVGKYTETLIQALSELDKENSYFLLFNNQTLLERTVSKLKLKDKPNFKPFLVPYSLFSLRNQILLPFKLSHLKIDIFHSTNFMAPIWNRCSTIVTIHDIILIHSPHFSPKAIKTKLWFIYKAITNYIARHADLIFTDSFHSKHDIVRYLDVSEDKVVPVYMGIDRRIYPPTLEEKISIKERYYSTEYKYMLYIGRQDPYKNLTALIKAFHQVALFAPDLKLKLIIVGEQDKRYPESSDLTRRLDLEEKVVFTGYVDDETLFDYFKMGDLLVLPSLYEGFGLPAIEAMACDIPVIVSNVASLPEVVGEAALLIDPTNIEEITKCILKVLTDESLSQDLKEKGRKQASKFTALEMARNVLTNYQRIK